MATASDLKHRVWLQHLSATSNGLGESVGEWVNVANMRCKIATQGGRELMASKAIRAEVTIAVTCRYRAEFSDPIAAAELRLLYKNRPLNILSVINEDERNRWVTLGCSEGLSDG